MLNTISIILYHFKIFAVIIWPLLLVYWFCNWCAWRTYGDKPDWFGKRFLKIMEKKGPGR